MNQISSVWEITMGVASNKILIQTSSPSSENNKTRIHFPKWKDVILACHYYPEMRHWTD